MMHLHYYVASFAAGLLFASLLFSRTTHSEDYKCAKLAEWGEVDTKTAQRVGCMVRVNGHWISLKNLGD